MFEKNISVTLKKTHQKLVEIFRQKISEDDLSFRLFHILVLIDSKPEANQKEIAKKMKITQGAMSGSIKRLIDLEMLQQIPLEEDNRYNKLEVTAKGQKVIKEYESHLNDRFNQMFVGFSHKDLELFNEFLNRLNKNLETIDEKYKKGV